MHVLLACGFVPWMLLASLSVRLAMLAHLKVHWHQRAARQKQGGGRSSVVGSGRG